MEKLKGVKSAKIVLLSLLAASLAACTAQPSGGTADQPQSPSTSPTAQGPTAQKAEWELEWEKVVAAAKKEGEIVAFGHPGEIYQKHVQLFQKAYPDIKVKWTGQRPNQTGPRIQAEQDQGMFNVDIFVGLTPNYPTPEASEDIRPYIILPELKDDKTWHGGFEEGFKMNGNTGLYSYAIGTYPNGYVNNDFIPEGGIKTFKDLADPKWKGKIATADFSLPSAARSVLASILIAHGLDFMRSIVEKQEIAIASSTRELTEWFTKGQYPIAIGADGAMIREFQALGAVKKLGYIKDEPFTVVSPFNLAVMTKPPHPNAAKVFVNWFLGKEAQTAWVELSDTMISRRVDAPRNKQPDVPFWDEIDIKHSLHAVEEQKAASWILQYGKGINNKDNIVEKGKLPPAPWNK